MANPITTTGTSLEAQVWETCHALQIAEKASTDDARSRLISTWVKTAKVRGKK